MAKKDLTKRIQEITDIIFDEKNFGSEDNEVEIYGMVHETLELVDYENNDADLQKGMELTDELIERVAAAIRGTVETFIYEKRKELNNEKA